MELGYTKTGDGHHKVGHLGFMQGRACCHEKVATWRGIDSPSLEILLQEWKAICPQRFRRDPSVIRSPPGLSPTLRVPQPVFYSVLPSAVLPKAPLAHGHHSEVRKELKRDCGRMVWSSGIGLRETVF